MNLGVKTYCNGDFLKKFEDKADFFEILAIEGEDYSFLKNITKPVVIHAKHEQFRINLSDTKKFQKNMYSIKFAIKLADSCNCRKIIVHPGKITGPSCSINESIRFLKSINDKRLLIENLPAYGGYLCSTPEELSYFVEKTGAGICFDVNHAISSAIRLGKDPYEFLKEFTGLNVSHYHLGGQRMSKDETHLSFKDSDIDLKKIFDILPSNADMTLETLPDVKKLEYDLEVIRKLTSISKD
jgi:uncharacterized protein (UPF0276 family)